MPVLNIKLKPKKVIEPGTGKTVQDNKEPVKVYTNEDKAKPAKKLVPMPARAGFGAKGSRIYKYGGKISLYKTVPTNVNKIKLRKPIVSK